MFWTTMFAQSQFFTCVFAESCKYCTRHFIYSCAFITIIKLSIYIDTSYQSKYVQNKYEWKLIENLFSRWFWQARKLSYLTDLQSLKLSRYHTYSIIVIIYHCNFARPRIIVLFSIIPLWIDSKRGDVRSSVIHLLWCVYVQTVWSVTVAYVAIRTD